MNLDVKFNENILGYVAKVCNKVLWNGQKPSLVRLEVNFLHRRAALNLIQERKDGEGVAGKCNSWVPWGFSVVTGGGWGGLDLHRYLGLHLSVVTEDLKWVNSSEDGASDCAAHLFTEEPHTYLSCMVLVWTSLIKIWRWMSQGLSRKRGEGITTTTPPIDYQHCST